MRRIERERLLQKEVANEGHIVQSNPVGDLAPTCSDPAVDHPRPLTQPRPLWEQLQYGFNLLEEE